MCILTKKISTYTKKYNLYDWFLWPIEILLQNMLKLLEIPGFSIYFVQNFRFPVKVATLI